MSGTNKAKIFERASLPAGAWSASATGEQSGGTARHEDIFIEYKDLLYGARDSRYFWSYNIATEAFTDSAADLTSFTNVAPPVIHSLDDIMYVGYDNKIAKNNNTSWTAVALTLPSNLVITSICEYGTFLAIGCRSKYNNGKSIVFLWDRDSTLTTLTAKIDWGSGNLTVLQELNGALIGITRLANSGTVQARIVFKAYTGIGAVTFKELLCNSTNVFLRPLSIRANKRIYFALACGLASTVYVGVAQTTEILEGVWSIGINTEGQYVLAHERTLNNDTDTDITTDLAGSPSSTILGFFLYGDYITVMYIHNSAYVALRSNNDAAYSASSLYETIIFNAGDSSLKKDLLGISVTHEPLPSSGQVIVSYRKDEETTWTTILTNTTDDAISQSAVNIETSGVALPKDYKEIQFRIASTGGAVITGLSFQEEITGKRNYGV